MIVPNTAEVVQSYEGAVQIESKSSLLLYLAVGGAVLAGLVVASAERR